MGNLLSIVISDNYIRIAELANGRKGVSVSRLLTREIPNNLMRDNSIGDVKAFAEFLADALRYANIKTKRAIFSLPTDKIMTREVILPEMNEEKTKTAIRVNAPDYFPIDLTDYVLAYFPIAKVLGEGEAEEDEAEDSEKDAKKKRKKKKSRKKATGKKKSGAKLRLMVVAAPNDMVQSYYDVAKLAHLKLESVDFLGNSVFQLTTYQIGEEPCLVIQLDSDHTVLTVFHDNIMVFQRHVDFGSASVVQAVMDARHLEYEEAEKVLEHKTLIRDSFEEGDEITETLYYLVSNIRRTIEYYTGRNVDRPIEQVYLMGEGVFISGVKRLFERQLEYPVQEITALKNVFIKGSTGLSMQEVLRYTDNIGAVLAPVNFIPKQLEQDLRRKLEAKAYRIMVLLALLASVVIVTVPATEFFSVGMDTIDLQNKLLLMEDVQPILDRYRQASDRYTDVKNVQSIVGTNNESLVEFVNIFEQLRPSDMSIASFSCNDGQISISALASGKKTVAKLIQQLNTIANVSEVKVSSLSSSFDGNQETVSFSLTCRLINAGELLYRDDSFDADSDQELADMIAGELEQAAESEDGSGEAEE